MKYDLKSFYTIDYFLDHAKLKPVLMNKILKSSSNIISPENNSEISISLSRADWENSSDFTREWVKELIPSLQYQLQIIGEQFGFKDPGIMDIWYQLYNQNNYHGWHHHGYTFTCVYYLDFPEGSPKTQLLCPTSNKIIEADVKEGDILIFPSYVIHRAPKVNENQKLIISWNMIWENFSNNMYNILGNKQL